mmetsp:Transcript_69948/g.111246  ORF Transcript_69948/g.111246 Transcript_69948/m.111246 type:complete len:91 (-) Transcript_69948:25-297(-)
MWAMFLRAGPVLKSKLLLLDSTAVRECGQNEFWYFELYFAALDRDDKVKANCSAVIGHSKPQRIENDKIGKHYLDTYPQCLPPLSVPFPF